MVQYLFFVCVFSSYATSLVAVHLFREKAREMGLHCTALHGRTLQRQELLGWCVGVSWGPIFYPILSFPVSLKVLAVAEPSVRMASWPRRRGDGWTDGMEGLRLRMHPALHPDPTWSLPFQPRTAKHTLSGMDPDSYLDVNFLFIFFFIVTKYYNRNCCVNIFFILALSLKIFIKIKPKISPIYFYIINIKLRYLSEYKFECFFPLFVVGSK